MSDQIKQVIEYDRIREYADKIKTHNDNLLNQLHDIQKLINGLEGSWESESAKLIRKKITDMEPKFLAYNDVVENYEIFLRNTATDYETAEIDNTSNAGQFM